MVALKQQVKRKATLTEQAIDAAIDADGGNLFRRLLLKHLPRIEDAYREDEENDAFRSHLGASLIGRECNRSLWYKWRWAVSKKFPPRILRLFNRGHMEEARFLALLEMIGVQFHEPEGGGQERISHHGGHFGSALDGTLWGVPDCPGEWVLGEFKTAATKPFSDVYAKGVRASKPEHYAQMQSCMARRGIHKCLYMMVNKNDDDIYTEVVAYDAANANLHLDKAGDIIFRTTPPNKLSEDPSHFKCTYCDEQQLCHYKASALVNCRTCEHSAALPEGGWHCNLLQLSLDKTAQIAGCEQHSLIPGLR